MEDRKNVNTAKNMHYAISPKTMQTALYNMVYEIHANFIMTKSIQIF